MHPWHNSGATGEAIYADDDGEKVIENVTPSGVVALESTTVGHDEYCAEGDDCGDEEDAEDNDDDSLSPVVLKKEDLTVKVIQKVNEGFKELDKALQAETGVIPANIQSILDGCSI